MGARVRLVEFRDVIVEAAKQESPRDGYKLVAAHVRLISDRGQTVPDELLHEQRRLLVECQAMSQGR